MDSGKKCGEIEKTGEPAGMPESVSGEDTVRKGFS